MAEEGTKRRGMRGGGEEGKSFSRDFFVLVEVCCARGPG